MMERFFTEGREPRSLTKPDAKEHRQGSTGGSARIGAAWTCAKRRKRWIAGFTMQEIWHRVSCRGSGWQPHDGEQRSALVGHRLGLIVCCLRHIFRRNSQRQTKGHEHEQNEHDARLSHTRHLNWTARGASASGANSRRIGRSPRSERLTALSYHHNKLLSVMPVTVATCAHWLSHLALLEKTRCAAAAFVSR